MAELSLPGADEMMLRNMMSKWGEVLTPTIGNDEALVTQSAGQGLKSYRPPRPELM